MAEFLQRTRHTAVRETLRIIGAQLIETLKSLKHHSSMVPRDTILVRLGSNYAKKVNYKKIKYVNFLPTFFCHV